MGRMLRRWKTAVVAVIGVGTTACGGGHVDVPDVSAAAVVDTTGLVARGEYIVRTLSVCGHCHAADPQADPDGPLSGGMEFRNWRTGTIRAANLTPDSATGLGEWTEAEIVRAVRNGDDHEGSVLAPIMPYEWLNGMSDRDALAVARYLKSQPPVRNEVRNSPNLVYGLARIFVLGPLEGRTRSAPPPGPTAEYGEYIANHVALCADCHTPRRGIMASPDRGRLFAGTSSPPSGFPANPSNLTPDVETGIGTWSEGDFVNTIRTGVNPAGDSLHVFMPWREYRRMEETDLRAIYRYLRTLPPMVNEVERVEG